MNIKLKWLLYIPIILFFFPAFAMSIPGVSVSLKMQFIALCFFSFILLVFNYKFVFKNLSILFFNTPLKLLLFILLCIIINTLFLTVIGIEKFSVAFSSIVMQIVLGICISLFYYTSVIDHYICYKNFIKFFILMFYCVLIFGFISWIGMFFNIELINNIFDFFANARILNLSRSGYDLFRQTSNYYAFGLPRLDNLYEEPGWYARFLLLFLPIVYAFGLTQIKLYDNKILNSLIKKTIIPLTWLSLILTFSPIFFLFAIILTIILFFKIIVKYLKYMLIPLCLLLLIIVIISQKIDFSETYISRIINVLTKIKSFEDFIIIEGSLATRVVSYVNSLCIFKTHFLTGVGLGNIDNYILNQFYNSPLPLTPEIQAKINFSHLYNVTYHTNIGFIYNFLAEHGIIITSLWVYFISKLYLYTTKITKFYSKNMKFSFEQPLSVGLKGCLISIILMSLYEIYFTMPEIYLIFVLVFILIFRYKRNIKRSGENL